MWITTVIEGGAALVTRNIVSLVDVDHDGGKKSASTVARAQEQKVPRLWIEHRTSRSSVWYSLQRLDYQENPVTYLTPTELSKRSDESTVPTCLKMQTQITRVRNSANPRSVAARDFTRLCAKISHDYARLDAEWGGLGGHGQRSLPLR